MCKKTIKKKVLNGFLMIAKSTKPATVPIPLSFGCRYWRLEHTELNWPQYQINVVMEMGTNTNSAVWLYVELLVGIS